ncbi:MAG: CsgG/HfaB family protein [Elusimicrobia bacterium]|nr:CsgG/HfaB family protein [Elusimicrobiota bacterium]
MKKIISICVLSVFVLAACAPSKSVKKSQAMTVKETKKVKSEYTGPKRRIGVVEFSNKTAYGQGRLGGSASDILITELVKSDKFIVVERGRMEKLMEEQKFQAQGTVDSNTAVKLGKIMGLEAIVLGTVSQFGVKTEGHDYLVKQGKRQIAEVTVEIRVVDVETGQVLLADSGKGITKRKWGSFLGMGTKGGYDETLEGDALRASIVQFVDNIINQLNKKPWSCMIADAYENDLYLNAGQESGIRIGTRLKCYHQGAAIKDPGSNLIIGHREEYIGEAEVVRYCGQSGDCSIANVIGKGSASPMKKDICRLAK